jgi:hypothetical protein
MVGLKRRRHRKHRRHSAQRARLPEEMDDWERHFLEKSTRRKDKRQRHERKRKMRRWIILTAAVAVTFVVLVTISRPPAAWQAILDSEQGH